MKAAKKEMMKDLGFVKEIENVNLGKCPFCGKTVKEKEFKDKLSLKEFKISGICQNCQNEFFTLDDE